MYALRLTPALKDYIWGGDALKGKWGKKTDKNIIAESWELSCHKDGESVIFNGEFKGMTLSEFIAKHPESTGTKAKAFQFFPILIKLIDAKQNLSIQVHPSDEYALQNEGQFGKSEMWYIVDAKPGAGVYCGFKRQLKPEDVARALRQNRILDVLNFIEVQKGDSIYIPAGTVHAICGVLLICEVQQNSSLTYRLYDYDRVDANGKKRELHIEKSLKVIDSSRVSKVNAGVLDLDDETRLLASCKYFEVLERTVIDRIKCKGSPETFVSLTVVEGFGEILVDGHTDNLNLGDTCFIPAGYDYQITGRNMKIIEAKLP